MKVKYIGPDYVALPTGTIEEVLSIERGWYRIMTEFDETYIFPPEVFEIIEGGEDEYTGPYAKKNKKDSVN